MVISGLFCGLAGAYLSLGYVSLFAKQMTDERGLIALAAIFFAKGRPVATTAVALLFGVATALAVRLPEMTGAAPQLLQMIPYVVDDPGAGRSSACAPSAPAAQSRLAFRDLIHRSTNQTSKGLPTMAKRKLILDVDTGTDDAVAIMCAALHPELELVACTTVNGNVEVQYCTNNTLRALEFVGRGDIPGLRGAEPPAGAPGLPHSARA